MVNSSPAVAFTDTPRDLTWPIASTKSGAAAFELFAVYPEPVKSMLRDLLLQQRRLSFGSACLQVLACRQLGVTASTIGFSNFDRFQFAVQLQLELQALQKGR